MLKERLLQFIKSQHLTVSRFESLVGLSNGTVSRTNDNMRPRTIESISNEFPQLNIQWLLTGEGEMLHPKQIDVSIIEEELDNQYTTWLVPMSAMGGSLMGFEESGVRRDDCEKVISPVAGADWAVPVTGDSMEPEYPNGSRVFVKQIDPSDFIAWGNVFVIDTTNGLIIKVVSQSDRDGYIKCVSLNPAPRYQPFDVPMRTIRAMYRVMACITLK